MTLDNLIKRLEQMRGEAGGDVEVKVVDDEGEWGFAIRRHPILDANSETGVSNVILLDITCEPEFSNRGRTLRPAPLSRHTGDLR